MSHYKPYPAYKDSGAEWLGNVPTHWDVSLLKYFARLDGGAGFPEDEQGIEDAPIPFFKVADLSTGMTTADNYITAETAERLRAKVFPEGTIAFAKVGAALLLNRRVLMKVAGCVDNNMMAALPRGVRAEWLLYLLTIFDMGWLVNPGAVPSVNQEQVGNIKLPIPTTNEQAAIVAHLDSETARIDALVEKKSRFIELLREKRQALITHAVTKGLDSSVPMKDSGGEWLGQVPEHWKVMPLQYVIADIEQGWSPECLATPAEPDEWGVVKSGCINGGIFAPDENKKLPPNFEPRPEIAIKSGDILMSRASGSSELIGSVGLVGEFRGNLMLSDKIFRIKLNNNIADRYFVLVMGSRVVRTQINNAISGAEGLANNLPQARIKKFWIALPDIEEQKKIVEFVGNSTSRLDGLIEKTKRSIKLLKEHRSALITAAVTGQIDLRASTITATSQIDMRKTA
ncbi:restriction endonuclease subunit S [Pandoraea pnomenusa]|uniref:restriction endonuclease subunit S n=1 Tax=Pandoraea pnomenusa TaxID=93220 RepID=UPI001AC436DA|nr:restriction endonuclease subunit S [Pandoraea pnomenusa]MBN9092535.1 restriction endonuclease subunit S [Pandoraea pnomenusa]